MQIKTKSDLVGNWSAVLIGDKESWAAKKGEKHQLTITISNADRTRNNIEVFVHTSYYGSGDYQYFETVEDFLKNWGKLKREK